MFNTKSGIIVNTQESPYYPTEKTMFMMYVVLIDGADLVMCESQSIADRVAGDIAKALDNAYYIGKRHLWKELGDYARSLPERNAKID